MLWKIKKSCVSGTLRIPPSKSHTIRALLIASIAQGESTIYNGLIQGDGKSALEAAEGLGVKYTIRNGTIYIKGIASDFSKGTSEINVGNSGSSVRFFTSVAALGSKPRTFDGDSSLRSRPMKPLLQSLAELGGQYSIHQSDRDIPFTISGPLKGGETVINGLSSQYLSSLLLTAPLLPKDTCINVENLHEKPYVEITLWWLDRMNISYQVSNNFSTFNIQGNQKYHPFSLSVPGDFSSATFGAVAAVLSRSQLKLENIDFSDPQGDKEIFVFLEKMGAVIDRNSASATIRSGGIPQGIEIDLNANPDALPALTVLGCFAEGTTSIVNVKQARIKETDRIKVMKTELAKMGARIEEKEDGLRIYNSKLTGCKVNGHHDHRVVMALALAGMIADGETVIETAESADITYPGFALDFNNIGADIECIS
ncbi:MAG: 3-phosphoshikimate 1-carboxyvinyltransferase [Chitinispirillia bacterium]|jgi:3-phosphoshikimate 1-carboxyvinyltransferase